MHSQDACVLDDLSGPNTGGLVIPNVIGVLPRSFVSIGGSSDRKMQTGKLPVCMSRP